MSDVRHTSRLRDNLVMIVEQGLQLLDHLDDESYAEKSSKVKVAAIGDHYRHHLDFIAAFLRGLDAGFIDYDDRQRDQQIATQRSAAREETQRLLNGLHRLDFHDLPAALEVVQRTADDGEKRPVIRSGLDREMVFLVSHSMHHYAIMGLSARFRGKSIPPNLGVMPSTLEYQRGDEQVLGSAAE